MRVLVLVLVKLAQLAFNSIDEIIDHKNNFEIDFEQCNHDFPVTAWSIRQADDADT
jgi:hypothetical protein